MSSTRARPLNQDTDARIRQRILARLDRIDVWSMPFLFRAASSSSTAARLRTVRGRRRRSPRAQVLAPDRGGDHGDRRVIVAEAGTKSLAIAFIGSAIVFFGFNTWVPMTYALSTESFPTRARVTGFGMVDGVGHLGGGIGVLLIAPQIPHMSVLGAT
jgi:hypothetical protein